MNSTVYNPQVTYRLQLHKRFGFTELKKIIPYLSNLGIKAIYASPVFSATPGSEHGYDGIDPLTINPEIGTLEELYEISVLLKEKRMGWIQDFVPNHMAFTPVNKWLMDVLEKGQRSSFAKYFDILWEHPGTAQKIMLPFFGNTLEEIIKNGQLKIEFFQNRLTTSYSGTHYPLNQFAYQLLINDEEHPEILDEWLNEGEKFYKMPGGAAFNTQWEQYFNAWDTILKKEDVRSFINNQIEAVNDDKKLIKKIIDQQYYLPCEYSITDHQINYRRFFTVNNLICMNMQDDDVFEHYHILLKKLCDDDVVDGVRVDHIDGLYDPGLYLEKLADHIGRHKYLVVEKILEKDEAMENWPVAGSTGYEFLATVNNVFTNKKSKNAFDKFYQQLTGISIPVEKQVYEKKKLILEKHMQGELDNLVRLFSTFNLPGDDVLHVFDDLIIRNAVSALLIYCPVYRFYFRRFPLSKQQQEILHGLFNTMLEDDPALGKEVALLEHVFIDGPKHNDQQLNISIAKFFTRCMQFSGPLMAKGVEDTLMYTFNRFIGHNEVGDSPSAFGISPSDFHKQMIQRQKQWPLALNGTATHDTKRGEDSRARLNVLTDIPGLWFAKCREWQAMNKTFKENNWPGENEEYFIYQTILAHYPLNEEEFDSFPGRFTGYLEKAGREAKLHTNWTEPNQDFENAITNFVNAILNRQTDFYKSFTSFLSLVKDHGVINSISQLILKFTCPGIPDIYQGCEKWDFSFVDPDNRRPVDYNTLESQVTEFSVMDENSGLKNLWANRSNGHIKTWFVKQLAGLRADYPDLFEKGSYKPLKAEGPLKEQVLAFTREYKTDWLLVVIPLHTASIEENNDHLLIDWSDTTIEVPLTSSVAVNVLNNEKTKPGKISLDKLFNPLPFALIKGKSHAHKRKAGLLLHISSLPSAFGIGDLGPGAFVFADFLHRSNQRVWQMLPLTPVEEGQGYSPYSSISSRAGNTFFISPECLVKDGLLTKEFLQQLEIKPTDHVEFATVEEKKKVMLDEAWKNYMQQSKDLPVQGYDEFCKTHREWLPDFALYCVIRNQNQGKPWYEWEKSLKNRDVEALEKFESDHQQDVNRIKWEQFIFSKQWNALKDHCNKRGIELLGDLPFYVSHDSADVWANQQIFKLDKKGKPLGIAGVPPDFFSEDGQLWGMPVFRWNVLRLNGFTWWAERLNRNIELFDLVRLDHFRAFSAYWEVSPNEKTAVNGKWKKVPGDYFFREMKKRLGKLPFIAEDLGDIDDSVYRLRDKFKFPGMKVLQCAFRDEMETSSFIPHTYDKNLIAYTGTHDNNTLVGWFEEADEKIRQQVEQYMGQSLTAENLFNVLGRSLYASVADTVIFPVQDILHLGADSRMNSPSTAKDNWTWRLKSGQLTNHEENHLKQWTLMYNR